ncbi:MAG: hypothetical protein ACOVLE_07030, partial [Pirellula staleyi]
RSQHNAKSTFFSFSKSICDNFTTRRANSRPTAVPRSLTWCFREVFNEYGQFAGLSSPSLGNSTDLEVRRTMRSTSRHALVYQITAYLLTAYLQMRKPTADSLSAQ